MHTQIITANERKYVGCGKGPRDVKATVIVNTDVLSASASSRLSTGFRLGPEVATASGNSTGVSRGEGADEAVMAGQMGHCAASVPAIWRQPQRLRGPLEGQPGRWGLRL